MKNGSTLFLKAVICLMGLAVSGLCVILAGVSFSGNAGMYLPMTLLMLAAAIPFFAGLYQGLRLLGYIEKSIAFSELSVRAIRTIKYCALSISALYAAGMPIIISIAHKDDAPGVVLITLIFMFAPLVVGVFAAVLQTLLQSAIDIKSENDLTV